MNINDYLHKKKELRKKGENLDQSGIEEKIPVIMEDDEELDLSR